MGKKSYVKSILSFELVCFPLASNEQLVHIIASFRRFLLIKSPRGWETWMSRQDQDSRIFKRSEDWKRLNSRQAFQWKINLSKKWILYCILEMYNHSYHIEIFCIFLGFEVEKLDICQGKNKIILAQLSLDNEKLFFVYGML